MFKNIIKHIISTLGILFFVQGVRIIGFGTYTTTFIPEENLIKQLKPILLIMAAALTLYSAYLSLQENKNNIRKKISICAMIPLVFLFFYYAIIVPPFYFVLPEIYTRLTGKETIVKYSVRANPRIVRRHTRMVQYYTLHCVEFKSLPLDFYRVEYCISKEQYELMPTEWAEQKFKAKKTQFGVWIYEPVI